MILGRTYAFNLCLAIHAMSDTAAVLGIVEQFFETGKTKDLAPLRQLQLDDSRFSSFSDVPPYGLKDFATSIALEELRFVSISDYEYEMSGTRVGMFGDSAVVAFELVQKGMLVDNKAFTGKHITINGRATFVLARDPEWKIVHIHMSQMPSD